MGLTAEVHMGSGRARCIMCGKLIQKDERQINVKGFRVSGAIHSLPWNCHNDRKEFTDVIAEIAKTNDKK